MKKLMLIGLVTLPLISGCATKMETGTALGALTGGALAYGLGKNSSNKDWWTVLGVGAGALIGNNIGQQLDQRDKLLLGQTVQHTLETAPNNSVGQWQNPNSGNSGSVVPTQTYTAPNGAPCREFVQTIYVGGYPEEGYGTACRQPDGSWQIVQR